MRHTREKRAKILAEMERSAARSPDRRPNITRIAAEAKVDAHTIRRWWRAAHPEHADAGTADHAADAPDTARYSTPDPSAHLEESAALLGIPDVTDQRVRLVARVAADHAACLNSETARVQAAKLHADLVDRYRVSVVTETGPATPDEIVARMLETPDLVFEAFLRCKDLHSYPELRALLGAAA